MSPSPLACELLENRDRHPSTLPGTKPPRSTPVKVLNEKLFLTLTAAVPEVQGKDPWESLRPLQDIHEVKTILTITPR